MLFYCLDFSHLLRVGGRLRIIRLNCSAYSFGFPNAAKQFGQIVRPIFFGHCVALSSFLNRTCKPFTNVLPRVPCENAPRTSNYFTRAVWARAFLCSVDGCKSRGISKRVICACILFRKTPPNKVQTIYRRFFFAIHLAKSVDASTI